MIIMSIIDLLAEGLLSGHVATNKQIINMCIYIYIDICMYIYIYIYTHTYICRSACRRPAGLLWLL